MIRFDPRACAVLISLVLAACGAGENPEAAREPAAAAESFRPDLEAVAHGLVNRSASVQEGDLVLLSGTPRDMELLENLAIHVRKLGAHPLITVGSERLVRRSYDDVPARFDGQRDEWDWRMAQFVDVVFEVTGAETPGLLAHVPPERLEARAQANIPIFQRLQERAVRSVEVGNGLYPTEARARELGIPRDELARIFWAGVATDPAEVEAAGRALREVLARGRAIRITTDNGTDLTVRIEPRTLVISDGAVSPEEKAAGGASTQVYLPAGEVWATTVPGSAEGTLVLERHFFRGLELRDVKLTFEAGRLVSFEAGSGPAEARLAAFEVASEGKDELSAVDFGINPGLTDHRLLVWPTSGMVSLSLGANAWAGGSNGSTWNEWFFLDGATAEVDGRVVLEDGVLKP